MKPREGWTIVKLLDWTTGHLAAHGIESPRLDAELLLAFVLETERLALYLRPDRPLHHNELDRFGALVRRRRDREPVAYLVGMKPFWTLDLTVGPEVLIPRPETECLVEAVLEFLKDRGSPEAGWCLDLGTGSGAIALALAQSCPAARIMAVDRSLAALATADRNRRRYGLEARVHLIAADWLASFSADRARFGVIVSNPPYIPTGRIDDLQPEISRYEPRSALDGGSDGLECLRLLVARAPDFLLPGGALFLEIGHDQFTALRHLAEAQGAYKHITCRQDYSGLDRVVRLVRS